MVQTESPSRRQRVERAIEHALANRWDAAAEENRALLDEDPDDTESANRLGKALTELEDYAGAVTAYAQALVTDPANPIARKNLAKLKERGGDAGGAPEGGRLKASKPSKTSRRKAGGTKRPGELRANSLIEESGKSAEFELIEVDEQALTRVAGGDAAALATTDGGVSVTTARGAELGTIERRAALRLKRMIEGGNEYAVVIRRIDGGKARVYIRESHTDPSLAGQASFIAPAKRKTKTRAYTRTSAVVQHEPDRTADPDDTDQDGAGADDSAATTESGEMEARGFSEVASETDDDEADDLADELDDFDDIDENEDAEPQETAGDDDEETDED
ncbi:MAG: hypothetical protein QF664_11265 [Dehalococcoidia bacterium]|jgi:hypothetical protein|nr:hypothetical protein [Dehalococcoidia bacterium]